MLIMNRIDGNYQSRRRANPAVDTAYVTSSNKVLARGTSQKSAPACLLHAPSCAQIAAKRLKSVRDARGHENGLGKSELGRHSA